MAFGKVDRVLNVLLRSGEIYGIRAVDVQYSCESPFPISQEPGNLWNRRFAALACPSSVRIAGDLVVSDHVAANVAVKTQSGQRRADRIGKMSNDHHIFNLASLSHVSPVPDSFLNRTDTTHEGEL